MKLLVVCDQGNNRSVTLAGQLKYMGYDVLTAGLKNNSIETLATLYFWADKIILTDSDQAISDDPFTVGHFANKVTHWNMGPDVYPRPYNPQLLQIVKHTIAQHQGEI